MFFVSGLHMDNVLQSSSMGDSGELQSILRKVTTVALLCTICFALRCIVWVIFGLFYEDFSLITETHAVSVMDSIVYPTLFYTIPDVVPSVGILIVMIPPMQPDTLEMDEDYKKELMETLFASFPQIDQDIEYAPMQPPMASTTTTHSSVLASIKKFYSSGDSSVERSLNSDLEGEKIPRNASMTKQLSFVVEEERK